MGPTNECRQGSRSRSWRVVQARIGTVGGSVLFSQQRRQPKQCPSPFPFFTSNAAERHRSALRISDRAVLCTEHSAPRPASMCTVRFGETALPGTTANGNASVGWGGDRQPLTDSRARDNGLPRLLSPAWRLLKPVPFACVAHAPPARSER